MEIEEAKDICERFALEHKVVFETSGECGFGRECVGFISKFGNYLDYNPHQSGDYEPITELQCPAVEPPHDLTPDAYHKHDCMAVLGRGDRAIIQLAHWVKKINAVGNVRVVEYETGATGLQATFSGRVGYAVVAGSSEG